MVTWWSIILREQQWLPRRRAWSPQLPVPGEIQIIPPFPPTSPRLNRLSFTFPVNLLRFDPQAKRKNGTKPPGKIATVPRSPFSAPEICTDLCTYLLLAYFLSSNSLAQHGAYICGFVGQATVVGRVHRSYDGFLVVRI